MKHKLISVALIAVLLCMVLGSSISCTPTTTYTLTITSTAGGSVTPGVGAHTYSAGTAVNLTATPDADYVFVEWTGDVGTIADDEDATTTITMNGDYTITANFALDITIIADVPDTSQPPTVTLATTQNPPTNFCAPMAMVNVLEYWDDVIEHANAQNVTAGLIPETAAEYLGYFMDTNNTGSPNRGNGADAHFGTWDKDIFPGTLEFVRWDIANPAVPVPPFPLPAGKLGYDWLLIPDFGVLGLPFYMAEIDAGRPLVACFDYWNPQPVGINYTDPESGETIDVFAWGDWVPCSYDPEECWDDDIGHAVTGVGYILNWDPDGAGPLPVDDYVIVHDNWPTTPRNVAIPWANWKSSHAADPGPE